MTEPTKGPDRTVLAVFAHPDDETFLAGPILAHYAARGVKVLLCCVTPEPAVDPASDAGLRRASLACAASVLGIGNVHHLDYAEADLSRATVDGLAADIAGCIRAVRPDSVITDAAYGSYGHPHHILVHRATLAAVQSMSMEDVRPRLYALAFPMGLVRLNERLMRTFGVHTDALGGRHDLNPQAILRDDHPATVRFDVGASVGARRRAAECYWREIASAPLPIRLLERAPLWVQQLIFSQARLTRLVPPPDGTLEAELFEGLP